MCDVKSSPNQSLERTQRAWRRIHVTILGLDHIVLCVSDVQRSISFYSALLGMRPHEERPGKWSLHFGSNKISLQDAASAPILAQGTVLEAVTSAC